MIEKRVVLLPAQPKKKRKKRQKRLYFTQVHEDAIIEYVATESIKVRTDLYVKYIGPAFDEMVDKIVYTYKFTNLPNIDYLRENEEKVLSAIKILFESAEDIEIFNKKAIYMYIREITGLSTKQIVSNLNRMKVKYGVFREKWNEGEL